MHQHVPKTNDAKFDALDFERLNGVQPGSLAVLATAAECGSFTEAARRAGITQSGVSQIIDRLEHQFGLAIFDRKTRPPRLTQEGREFCALLSKTVSASRAFLEAVDRLKTGSVEALRFGINEVASLYAGPEIEVALMPEVRVFEAESALIPKIHADFAAGSLDVVVAPDVPAENRLIATALLKESYLFVHPKTASVPEDGLPLARLFAESSLPFISYRRDSLDWRKSLSMLRMLNVSVDCAAALDNTQAVANAVVRGLGWTILPAMSLWCVRDSLDAVTVHPLGGLSSEKVLWACAANERFKPFAEKAAAVFRERFASVWGPAMTAKKPYLGEFITLL